jgi:alpha-galactosidase
VSEFVWGHEALRLSVAVEPAVAPHLAWLGTAEVKAEFPGAQPLVEVVTPANGHLLASKRLVQTEIGASMVYVDHVAGERDGWVTLDLDSRSVVSGTAATLHLSSPLGVAALRSSVTIRNTDPEHELRLLSVTSWAQSFGAPTSRSGTSDWRVQLAESDWLAEGRWRDDALADLLPAIGHRLTGLTPRNSVSVSSSGAWSTGRRLPVGVLYSSEVGLAWAWQIEHNGPWRFELGLGEEDGFIALSGPTDLDHQWSVTLAPGESFTTVPVTVSLAADAEGAISEMTRMRRASRRSHPDNQRMPVVFNDYMNTLNGNPTAAKLAPLIDAASSVGAEIFCIDAGWYTDEDDWWDEVGAWTPSSRRFPEGLERVTERVRQAGMRPGIWLEPEVVGVHSPIVPELPKEVFLSRDGVPVVEQGRMHFDLRNETARNYIDGVIERLVETLGVGYFKLDYNIDPGAGTDRAASSVGAGMLEHNRAYLGWLEHLLDTYRDLVIENCGSGAMRADPAMLARVQLQSTSDQQDFTLYPPIAAAAAMSMLPEQAANWAYPQPDMTDEQIGFTLATTLLGRFYLSGHLDRMTEDQLQLVRDAVAVHKRLRGFIAEATPFWPLGLPGWTDEWVAYGLRQGDVRLIAVWQRGSAADRSVVVDLPQLRGLPVTVETLHPRRLTPWGAAWDQATGCLRLTKPVAGVSARVLRITPGSE